MKTIGTCENCKWWEDRICKVRIDRMAFHTSPHFSCVHFGSRDKSHHFPSENYPTLTAQDLEIEGLKRENDAAFQRIQELSAEIARLGYDPTAKKTP